MVNIPVIDAANETAAQAAEGAAAAVPEGAIYNPQAAHGNLHLGIDVGSTTVKLAVLNDDNQIVYAKYQRHHTDVRACARDLFVGAAGLMRCASESCGARSCVPEPAGRVRCPR